MNDQIYFDMYRVNSHVQRLENIDRDMRYDISFYDATMPYEGVNLIGRCSDVVHEISQKQDQLQNMIKK